MRNHRSVSAVAAILAVGAMAAAQQDVQSDATSVHNHVVKRDGRTIRIEFRDGEIVSATVNGEEIPAEEIEHLGDGVYRIDGPEEGEDVVIDVSDDVTREVLDRVRSRLRSSISVIGPEGASRSFVIGPDGAVELGEIELGDVLERNAAIAFGELFETPKAMIGVQLDEPGAQLAGHFGFSPHEATLLTAIYPDLPAAKAGLEEYDLVVAIGGERPAGRAALRKALADSEPGDTLTLTVIHRGEEREVDVTLAPYDEESLRPARIGARGMQPDQGFWRVWEGQDGTGPFVLPPDVEWTPLQADPLGGGLVAPAPLGADPALTERVDRLEAQLGRLEALLERLNAQLTERHSGEMHDNSPDDEPPAR